MICLCSSVELMDGVSVWITVDALSVTLNLGGRGATCEFQILPQRAEREQAEIRSWIFWNPAASAARE